MRHLDVGADRGDRRRARDLDAVGEHRRAREEPARAAVVGDVLVVVLREQALAVERVPRELVGHVVARVVVVALVEARRRCPCHYWTPSIVGDDVGVRLGGVRRVVVGVRAEAVEHRRRHLVCGSGSPSALAIAARSFATSSALFPLVASSSSRYWAPSGTGPPRAGPRGRRRRRRTACARAAAGLLLLLPPRLGKLSNGFARLAHPLTARSSALFAYLSGIAWYASAHSGRSAATSCKRAISSSGSHQKTHRKKSWSARPNETDRRLDVGGAFSPRSGFAIVPTVTPMAVAQRARHGLPARTYRHGASHLRRWCQCRDPG